MTTSAFERFTAKTAAIPGPYLATLHVAIFNDRPDLATAFCSQSCAVAMYADGPDGFLTQKRQMPGYLRIECPCCGRPFSEQDGA